MIEISPKETEIIANWHDAILYCQFLEVDGKKEWRLPTKEELGEIYKEDNDNSVGLAIGKLAWFQDMSNGYVYSGYKGNRAYIRAVRDI